MPSRNEIAAPAETEHNTLYLAIEISGKSWVVGVKSPNSERIRPSLARASGRRRAQESDRATAGQGRTGSRP